MKIRADLTPGNKFPDFKLPDQDGIAQSLSSHMRGWPTVLTLYRGTW